MPTLYVTHTGARLEKEYGRLLVTVEGSVVMSVPIAQVDTVVLVGMVGMTTQAMHALLEKMCQSS